MSANIHMHIERGGCDCALKAELVCNVAVGGIAAGTVYPVGTGWEQIMRDMFSKANEPTLTAPSATLQGPANRLIESGTTTDVTLTATFNRGSIVPAYGTSGFRAGEATGYSINGGAQQASNVFTVTASDADPRFTVTVYYAAGEQPRDSAGGNFDAPLPAGDVETNTIVFEVTDAIWSNAADITTIAKEPLMSRSVGIKEWAWAPQTKTNPETFDIPASWNVVAVEVFNDITRNWDDAADEFDVSDATHGVTAYKRYQDNRGYSAGERRVRVRWA